MNIKSLELIGFKSFYNKASIEFHKGINGIVGPNGCGKSNVIDAIRWVLGEQNSRLLRADGSMEELISTGSESMNPLGMAEATMVIENVPGSGFDEVAIKRRLYRSGESEYYINGVRCRLKDIREMFMDTGVGSRAYSIIGQGKVEEFITAKPEDKRKLIEEVAGIVKYKTRRRETQSRLESTRENLSRIQDMKSEVSRQMNSLSRQAKNAENYKKLSGEARVLELKILGSKKLTLENKIEKLAENKSTLRDKLSGEIEKKQHKNSVLQQMEAENSSLEERLSGLEDEIFRLKSELNNKNSFSNYASKEISNTDSYLQRITQEIEALENERKEIKQISEHKQSELEDIRNDATVLESQIREKSEELQKVSDETVSKRQELQKTREKLYETINTHSNSRESLFATSKEVEELNLRKERARQEKANLQEEFRTGQNQRDNYEKNKEEKISSKKELEENIEVINARLSSNRSLHREKLDKIEELKTGLNQCSSRVEALKQIQSNYEWLPEATRKFLFQSKGNGILGVITDYISAPKNYEKALEAALAEKLNWVVVKESTEAVRAVQALRQSSMGRSTFLPINSEYVPSDNYKYDIEAKPVKDIVKVTGIDKEIIDFLLSGVFVVSDLGEALSLKKQTGNGTSFVTLDGDYLDSSGAISGGYTSGGVFERKTEISELKEKIKTFEEQISEVSSESDSYEQKIKSDEQEISRLEEQLRSVDIELIELKKDLSALDHSLEKNSERSANLDNEIENITRQISEKSAEMDSLKNKVSELEDAKNEINLTLAEYEREIEELENQENDMEQQLGSLKVENASLTEKKRSLEYELNELNNRYNKTGDKITEKYAEIENKKKEKEQLLSSLENNKNELLQLSNSVEQKQQELDELRSRRQNEKQELKKIRSEVEDLDRNIEDLRDQISQLEVRLNSAQIEHQHVIEQAENVKEGEEEQAGISPQENFNLEEAEERLSELKKKIDRFGLVNLLAPEEYKNLEERHKFLEEQTNDLEEAMESLKKAMNKLDRESVTRFREAFEIINTKFQEILSRLFTGGEGKLVIVDPEDILQTGIEVMVKPRGKKYQSINLLSGGEKALSAIALIISACFVKPVPFLILDEIDAPLDEANTVRFTELLREIASESQIIVITHNKVTMQTVDSLIGVTSDRSTTSKIVSVDMQAHH